MQQAEQSATTAVQFFQKTSASMLREVIGNGCADDGRKDNLPERCT